MELADVILMALVALGALAVLASRRWARGLGFPLVLLALAGAVVSMLGTTARAAQSACVLTFLLALTFWLVDRGIPGNRSRPLWLVVGGTLMLLTAIVGVVTTLPTVPPLQI